MTPNERWRLALPTTVVGSYSVPEWLERLKTDIDALETRKASLESSVADLELKQAKTEEQLKLASGELEARKNSVFYEADLADRLRARGVLRMFNRVEERIVSGVIPCSRL